jgi:hypothetical protein
VTPIVFSERFNRLHAKEEEFLAFQRENNIQIRPIREVQGAA